MQLHNSNDNMFSYEGNTRLDVALNLRIRVCSLLHIIIRLVIIGLSVSRDHSIERTRGSLPGVVLTSMF